MSDENPKQEQTPVDNSEETVDNSTTTENQESSDDSYYQKQIEDLQSQLDRQSEEKENLKTALKQEREKRREGKEESQTAETPTPSLDEDKVLNLVKEATDQRFTEMQVNLAAAAFDEELSKISINEKEKELIKLHYRTKIKPSGADRASIRKDLMLSKAAANLDRVKFSSPEGDVSLATSMSGGGGKISGATTEPQADLSPAEKKILKNFGVDEKKAAKKLAEQSR